MINRILGVGWKIAVLTCIQVFSPLSHATFACGDLFEPVDRTRELSARFLANPAVKQERLEAFVPIRGGRELYVDFLKPAPGKPTIVLINGLTYRLGIWDAFVGQLKGDGLGILRYDPMGMGKTLDKYGAPSKAIDIIDQVKDLNSLLSKLGINTPVHLLGLSYGGGMNIAFGAMFPKKVASLILQAPLTGPLPKLEADIRLKIAMTRAAFPMNPASDGELYRYFLRDIVYTTYWVTEPIVLEQFPYKLESVYRMTEGSIDFRASNFVKRLPAGKVHLMVADKDQYIPADILEEFWNSIPTSARSSRLFLQHSEHKIPEAMPHFSAEWVKLIIAKDPRLQKGDTWKGGVYSGGVDSESTRIEIK